MNTFPLYVSIAGIRFPHPVSAPFVKCKMLVQPLGHFVALKSNDISYSFGRTGIVLRRVFLTISVSVSCKKVLGSPEIKIIIIMRSFNLLIKMAPMSGKKQQWFYFQFKPFSIFCQDGYWDLRTRISIHLVFMLVKVTANESRCTKMDNGLNENSKCVFWLVYIVYGYERNLISFVW